jgi:hypothetical protein
METLEHLQSELCGRFGVPVTFPQRHLAVETDWRLFLDHWDDFCYPSDDSNILVLPTLGKAVVYIEERWYVLDNLANGMAFEPRGAR